MGYWAGREEKASLNVAHRRRADDNVGQQLQAETLLDAGLISRHGVPAAGNAADRSRAVPLLDPGNRGALAASTLAPFANRNGEPNAATIRVSRRE